MSKKISKKWLKLHYLDLRKTANEISEIRGVHKDVVYDYVKKYGLSKKANGVKSRRAVKYKMPELIKKKHRIQPHSKLIGKFSLDGRELERFCSISSASEKLGARRELIRRAIKKGYGVKIGRGKYKFKLVRTYGEELIYRLEHLDFTKNISDIIGDIYSNLPKKMSRDKAILYYNGKLKKYWKEVNNY